MFHQEHLACEIRFGHQKKVLLQRCDWIIGVGEGMVDPGDRQPPCGNLILQPDKIVLVPLYPEAADHQGDREGRFLGERSCGLEKTTIQGRLRRAEVRRQEKSLYGMFGFAQAIVLERVGGRCLAGECSEKRGLPPSLIPGRARGEDLRGRHPVQLETLRIEDEKEAVITVIVSADCGQKYPFFSIKGDENRLIV